MIATILLLPCIFKNYTLNSLLVSKLDKILGDKDAVANIAVKSLKVAKKFYEDTLGLIQVGAEDEELIAFKSGNTTIYIYQSQNAGTNQATAVTWVVGEEIRLDILITAVLNSNKVKSCFESLSIDC